MKWWLGFACALSVNAWALDETWVKAQEKKMEQILVNSKIPVSNLGLYVAGGEGTPKVIFQKNFDKKMIPASITKLVTAGAAIQQFPPGTKFKTSIWTTSPVENGVLKGDIYLRGGGDPGFVSETMWYLVNVFSRNGIQTVDGDIIVDDNLFDKLRFDPSRQEDRVDRAYDAPTGAMSFNWNSVNIFVRPGARPGEPARVYADPENAYIQLKAKVETISAGGKTAVDVEREESAKAIGDVVIVSGKIAADSKELVVYKNITQPDLWSGYNLRSFLQQRSISIRGSVKTGVVPGTARLLAEAESKPIQDILADMNKFSNNYVAEMVTKNLAAAQNPPGSIEKGVKSLNQYMNKLGVPSSHYVLLNPSGLTRDNKLTAFSVWKVLGDMKSDFRFQPEFIASLPIAGVAGTLKNRFKGTAGERWVRAKTGFLTGVVSLAGYAGRSDGTVIPFVFIFNGTADESQVRSLFDRLATSIVE